jgi:sugar (pentulose or hexulose) kinase
MITCTAVFDIGKTNKKLILFDDAYHIVKEFQVSFKEIEDEDGFPCDDLQKLSDWMLLMWWKLEENPAYLVKALNFTTYGASFVHLAEGGQPVTPLYSYLKPLPDDCSTQFYHHYGDKEELATQTASPPLGMLNSALQLYWLKHRKPELFRQIRTSLHFPQYCAYLFTNQKVSEYTSIGCHTALWNFGESDYHEWVRQEGLLPLFPPIQPAGQPVGYTRFREKRIPVGTGLHDSSSALIPYLRRSPDPFLLLSTGTWCITLNPFAQRTLTREELLQDCLNYFTHEGHPVKAARLFTGNEHNHHTRRLAEHFHKDAHFYKTVSYDESLLSNVPQPIQNPAAGGSLTYAEHTAESTWDLSLFESYKQAYHAFVADMVNRQVTSIHLAGEGLANHRKLYVDGGFCQNRLFMQLLARALPQLKIEAFEENQGTALGAAMVMG